MLVDLPAIRQAVSSAGNYTMLDTTVPPVARPIGNFTRRILTLFGVVFGAVLFMVIVGEWQSNDHQIAKSYFSLGISAEGLHSQALDGYLSNDHQIELLVSITPRMGHISYTFFLLPHHGDGSCQRRLLL